jgi:hypothetical protein
LLLLLVRHRALHSSSGQEGKVRARRLAAEPLCSLSGAARSAEQNSSAQLEEMSESLCN